MAHHHIQKIVILTGAGISAESGLETFRASDGLSASHRIEDGCTYSNEVRPSANAQNQSLFGACAKPIFGGLCQPWLLR
jgi:NAD-dependent SIR2 family protein deacetylase